MLHHMKVLLNSFHLNGHTLRFDPQTQTLEAHFIDASYDSGSERVTGKVSMRNYNRSINVGLTNLSGVLH